MLSLFNKSESNLQEKDSNSFSVTSFLGLPSAPTSAKKTSGGAKDKAENYLDFTKELKELKSVPTTKPLDKKKDSGSKDKSFNKDSKDWNRSSHQNRNESYDKTKDYRRDDERKFRESSNNYSRDNKDKDRKESAGALKVNRSDSLDFSIKKKSNVESTGNSSPKIKKVDSSATRKPQVSSSMSSSRPDSKSTSQQSASRPQSSNTSRLTPVTAQAKGRSFNPSLDKLPKYVVPGQSSKSGTGSVLASGSKPVSSSIKPSSGMNGSSKPMQSSKPPSGKPLSSNSSQSRPSSGNTMSRPINGKPVSSNMTSRPSSQQPIKRPISNGMSAKPSTNGGFVKPKSIPPKPISAPAVRYVNGKPVPIKGGEAPSKLVAASNDGQSNLGKRPGDHLGGSRFEPGTGKKPVTTFNSVFKGGPSKKMHRGFENSEDEDDYEDDFIDDGDPNEEAAQELKKMFGKYRQRVERTRHLVDDASDMEAGFDVIEREEEISKLIGDEEDRRQFEYIKREAEEEAKRERMKRKKLQLD